MAFNAPGKASTGRLRLAVACALGALAFVLLAAGVAEAKGKNRAHATIAAKLRKCKRAAAHASTTKARSRKRRACRQRAQARRRAMLRRFRRANRRVGLSGNRALGGEPQVAEPSEAPSEDGVLDAGFEHGLDNWNTAGVGEVMPSVTGDVVDDGSWSGRFALTGSQHRSELILGGNGNGSVNDAVRFYEGSEHYYAFSFYIHSMTYGEPGAHNLIMQLKGTDEGSPYFGLQLWDYEGDDGESGGRGLWSHGEGMGGDRFLSPVSERSWHDVVVHFETSAHGNGFYEVFLDGELVDEQDDVTLIPPGASHDYIKSGLYRNGGEIPGSSEIRLDAVRLGPSMASVTSG